MVVDMHDIKTQSAQRPSLSIVRPSEKAAVSTLGGAMADPNAQGGQWLAVALPTLAKLVPAGLGAAIMIAVDPPEDKKELFTRVFVGLGMGGMFTEVTIDLLRSISWFSALDPRDIWHVVAIAGVWGGIGWFAVGIIVTYLKRVRADPVHTLGETKRELL